MPSLNISDTTIKMRIKRLRYITSDLYSGISIAMMWLAALFSLLSDSANKLGLYVALPIAFLASTLQNRGFRLNIYEKILYTLFAWDCIAYLWADNKELASIELHALLGAFLLTYVVSIQGRKLNRAPYLYFVWVLLYISAWNYAVHHILVFMTDNTDRLNDENLNANTLAYYTFYFSFLCYVLSEIVKHKLLRRLWTIAFWAMLPISFGVALLTASRQVLVIQIPLYAMLIYIRFIKGISLKRKILFCIIVLICLIAASGQVEKAYEDSFLKQRAERSITEDSRFALIGEAIQVGIDNFPLGIGSANFQAVSQHREIAHNSYLEAFADMGIIGTLLYTSLMVLFTLRQWRRYRQTGDKMYFTFFTFGMIYSLYGFFFVFYNAIWLISFFMLVAAHSEAYHEQRTKKETSLTTNEEGTT
mgnify:FL=1